MKNDLDQDIVFQNFIKNIIYKKSIMSNPFFRIWKGISEEIGFNKKLLHLVLSVLKNHQWCMKR